jgi:F-type H+-transporting ATPase subunit a
VGIEEVFPQVRFWVGAVPIRDTVLHTWILMVVLVAGAVWAHRRFQVWDPKTWQLAVEYIVDYIENLIRDTTGHAMPELVPYLTTMISYILLANLLSTFPLLSSPTRDLNTTLALSVVSFGSWHYYGIQKRGLGPYLHSFIEPMVFLLPLNILGLVSRVVSMALRLFGNVIAGEMIGAVMFMLVPLLIPLPLSALGMITGVLQALVFTVLTLVFVVDAIGSEEDEAAVAHVPSTT